MRIFNRQIIIALLLTAAICFASFGFACKKEATAPGAPSKPAITREQGIAYAKDIASGLRSALPIVAQLKPAAIEILQKGIPIADKVIAAVERSAAASVASLLNELIPIVNEVAGMFSTNIKVLAFIALADIGIHFLINHAPEIFGEKAARAIAMEAAAPMQGAILGPPIVDYARQPVWGCKYYPEKCQP